MDFATDEEILHAEHVLLPSGKHFSDERRAIIKNNSSADFHACPGSGKTTVLLAKLIILANRMPLSDVRGICVLTHTNVAIDEIKARLGEKSNVLFTYPNFFGTFQTFVHKFFTEPALLHYYNTKIYQVDDDYANNSLSWAIKKDSPTDSFLRLKHNKSDLNKKMTYYDYKKNVLQSCVINWEQRKIEMGFNISLGFDSKTGNDFISQKLSLLKQGILSFDDAYQLAFRYINEVQNVSFKKILENRFAYLFIDEYQDVNPSQEQLINSIFLGEDIIRQTFGDSDQAIFQDGNSDIEVVNTTNNSINDSCRFGKPIAKVLQTSCVRAYQELIGSTSVDSFKPILLVFSNAQNVLPNFAEILRSKCNTDGESLSSLCQKMHKEDPEHRIFVKAVGFHIETDNDSLDIKSYFPNYNRANSKIVKGELHLLDYLTLNSKQDFKEYRTNLMNAILMALDVSNIQNENRKFTKTTLLKYLREKCNNKDVELKSKIAKWTRLQACGEWQNVKDEMSEYLRDFITLFHNKFDTASRLEHFLSSGEERTAEMILPTSNLYHDDQSGLDIEVATIHSVKGETHVATLYLETSFHKQTESQRFKSSFEGELSDKSGEYKLKHSRGMYVGMSRPKYLLCCAVRKDHYLQMDNNKVKQNWEIVEIE